MSYIGNSPITAAFLTDTFSGNGSTTAFTMSIAPAGPTSCIVAISGVVQDPSTYSTSGTTLTFSAAPPPGTSNISVRYLGIPASGVTTTAYRTITEFTATAGQTSFSTPSYTIGFINVYRNGALLGTADYTATTGTTVVLATGATAGDLVVVESFYVSSVLNAIAASPASVGTTYLVDGSVTQAKLNIYQAAALVVAGGGSGGAGGAGGGAGAGGGGGGGGVLEAIAQFTSGTSYTVTVGNGGAAVLAGLGNQGSNSSITGLTPNLIAVGGGAGNGATVSGTTVSGGSGGSGGGSANWNVAANTFTQGGVGTGNQGFQAGYAQGTSGGNRTGSGGGGAGGPGGNGIVGTVVGWGGPGKASSISGTLTYYGGGGGGSTDNPGGGGAGGTGGGGAGSNTTTATSGTANTGGGGGGSIPGFSGAGGSGIVIISYANATQRGTGGTVTSYSSGGTTYWVHTFTSSGTYIA